MNRRASLLIEGLLFLAVALVAFYSYSLATSRVASNTGGSCPDGSVFQVGPGNLNVTYNYLDRVCSISQRLTLTLRDVPQSLCARDAFIANSSLVLPFKPGGEPASSSVKPAYALTGLGVRPAYEASYNGSFYVSLLPLADRSGAWMFTCPYAGLTVNGTLRVYYDQGTGLPLKVQWVYPQEGGNETLLWQMSATGYRLASENRVYAPGLITGIAYAGTAGVLGVALGLGVKRLFEAAV